jgi:hypothetical protein
MERKPIIPGEFSYDEVDAFVAAVFRWCESLFDRSEKSRPEPAFSEEWERKQMAHELGWN